MPAHFDAAGPALVVDHLTLHDPGVVAEARRWSTGHRGAAMPTAEMTGCDLTAYVSQAVIVGAHAIATAGGAQEAYRLDALVADVGERTTQLSREAERATGQAIQQATATIEASTAAVRTTIDEIAAQSRRTFTESVETAGTALRGDLTRLLGGENPELLARLVPVLERFGRELETRTTAQTGELVAKAARLLDPADPASPAAQQARALAEQQERLPARSTRPAPASPSRRARRSSASAPGCLQRAWWRAAPAVRRGREPAGPPVMPGRRDRAAGQLWRRARRSARWCGSRALVRTARSRGRGGPAARGSRRPAAGRGHRGAPCRRSRRSR